MGKLGNNMVKLAAYCLKHSLRIVNSKITKDETNSISSNKKNLSRD